jgi:hypothetical protein
MFVNFMRSRDRVASVDIRLFVSECRLSKIAHV